jgi:hypothetical protein
MSRDTPSVYITGIITMKGVYVCRSNDATARATKACPERAVGIAVVAAVLGALCLCTIAIACHRQWQRRRRAAAMAMTQRQRQSKSDASGSAGGVQRCLGRRADRATADKCPPCPSVARVAPHRPVHQAVR